MKKRILENEYNDSYATNDVDITALEQYAIELETLWTKMERDVKPEIHEHAHDMELIVKMFNRMCEQIAKNK